MTERNKACREELHIYSVLSENDVCQSLVPRGVLGRLAWNEKSGGIPAGGEIASVMCFKQENLLQYSWTTTP